VRGARLIYARELAASFATWSGFVIVALMLAADGLLFNAFAVGGGAKRSADVVADFFTLTSGITLIGSVFLSMRTIAEERQTGTMALLASSPVQDWEIVLGKFAAALTFLTVFFAATAAMPALVAAYGKISLGHIAAGYVGLLLVGALGLAIGVFGSAISESQVAAAVVSGMMVLALTTCWLLGRVTDPPLIELVTAIAWWGHFDPFRNGIVAASHVSYFALGSFVALFAATRVLEARRWR
jgi:ABC-2 type transport system permease protein